MISTQHIIDSLNSPDEEVRLQVLRELAHLAIEDALQAIFKALGDESWRVRKEAVNLYLGLPTAERLAGQVVELLHSEDNAGLRNAAVEILVRLGRVALPYLHEEINCNDHDVRKFVVDILGDIRDDSSIPYLKRALREDVDQNVRAAAAENLGKLRAVSAVPSLVETLACPDLLLQFAILEALSQIGAPVSVTRLMSLDENRLLRKPLFDCLGRIGGADAIDPLIGGLCDGMTNVREAAAVALIRLADRGEVDLAVGMKRCRGGEAVSALISMLSSPSIIIRRAAIQLLGAIGDRSAAVPLLELFDEEELLAPASIALISLGREAVCDLVDIWPVSSTHRRTYLAYIFAEAGCTNAVGLLTSSLYSDDLSLRVISLRALGTLGSSHELPEVVRFLADDEAEVRNATVEALIALGRRCHSEVFEYLKGHLSHEMAAVRSAAVQVAGRLGGSNVEQILILAMKDESSSVRQAALRFLDGAVPDHVQILTLALTDEESDVRRQTVESLANCRDDSVLPALSLALADEDLWVRTATIRALGRIGSEQALSFVRQGLRDQVGLVIIAALEVLATYDPFPIDEFCEVLVHPDDEVVTTAARLLGDQPDCRWLSIWGEKLLNHHYWDVRLIAARSLVQHLGIQCRPLIEARLLIEGEGPVREELLELLEYIAGAQG